jgi:hypothetical protein
MEISRGQSPRDRLSQGFASRQGRWTESSSGALSGREALANGVRGLRPRLISGVPSGC